jgi:hypothetical protein
VLIYKWVPIIGPVLGSAFVIGLYVAARLLKGDLTDRMKMMDEVSRMGKFQGGSSKPCGISPGSTGASSVALIVFDQHTAKCVG